MYIHMDSMCLFVLTLRDITHTDTHIHTHECTCACKHTQILRGTPPHIGTYINAHI